MLIYKKLTFLLIGLILTSCTIFNNKKGIDATLLPTFPVTPSVIVTQYPINDQLTPSPSPFIPGTIMPDKEAFIRLDEMLHTGNKCELPCWLNVIPGRSDLMDVQKQWEPLLGIASHSDLYKTGPGYLVFYYDMTGYKVTISTHFYLSDQGMDLIKVKTQVSNEDEKGFHEIYSHPYIDIFSAYILPNVLSTYGTPTQTIVNMEIVNAEPTSPDHFNIWLLYPERGFIVNYRGSVVVKENNAILCPSKSFVSFWLLSPKNNELFKKTLLEATGLKDIAPAPPFYLSTEDAIGLTSDKFYELFKKPTNKCLESPLSKWVPKN